MLALTEAPEIDRKIVGGSSEWILEEERRDGSGGT